MIDDVLGLLDYYTWTAPARIRDRCSPASCSFARTADSPSSTACRPGTAPPRRRRFPPGSGPGLLTRALFLASAAQTPAPDHEGCLHPQEHALRRRSRRRPPGANARAARAGPGHDDAPGGRGDHRDARDSLRRAATARPSIRWASPPRTSMRSAGSAPSRRSSTPPARRPAQAGRTQSRPAGELRRSGDDLVADAADAPDRRQRQGRGLPRRATTSASPTRRWEDLTADGCALEDGSQGAGERRQDHRSR